ncbi:MAG: hypothetical protein HY560_11680, partial [Gemmatimonadetes bacterium]|nr:hypothetical protein [Gemmatimonadota bacterium]
ARGGFEDTPLPWDRTYVLFVPAPTGSNLPAQVPADGFLEALAREAVGVEARAAEIAGGWRPDSCASPVAFRPDSRPQASRLVYPTEDATARELAHRLVTVAGAPVSGEWVSALFRNPASAPFPVAVGLPSSAWLAALARGGEAAYVFALLANGPAACSPPFRPPGAWFALVDTRAHLAARAGVGGLYVDWDGTPHVRDRR